LQKISLEWASACNHRPPSQLRGKPRKGAQEIRIVFLVFQPSNGDDQRRGPLQTKQIPDPLPAILRKLERARIDAVMHSQHLPSRYRESPLVGGNRFTTDVRGNID